MSKWPSVDRKRKSAAIHHFDIQYFLFDIRYSLDEPSTDRSNLLGKQIQLQFSLFNILGDGLDKCILGDTHFNIAVQGPHGKGF